MVKLLAALAAFSLSAVVSLCVGFYFAMKPERRVLARVRGVTLHYDEVFGLAGMIGCGIAALAHVAIYAAVVLS